MRGIWKVTLLVGALFLAAPGAQAQGSRKQDIVFNRFGQPVAGATVTVCTAGATGTPCSPLATIYSNVALTSVQANPFTTDGLGNYNFYAAPGRYQIQFSGAGLTTTTIPDVILPCDPSNCSASSISVTNGISAFSLTLSGNLAVSGSVTTGSLSPTSLSTAQSGAAAAQVGPHWYPGTATGTCLAPNTAPSVFVDATVTGSIGTATNFYVITYFNKNGETPASPVTTFAAASGATNAILVRPAATDLNWKSGCYGYRVYVSNVGATGPFYLQTPYANAVATTGHYNPGDAIFQSFTFSGTQPPATNTATIDPLQVALNATSNYSGNDVTGLLVVPQGVITLTTPLIVTNTQRVQGATKGYDQGASVSFIKNGWTADAQVATVMVMGPANAVHISGVDISGTGDALFLLGAGPNFQTLTGFTIRDSSVRTTSSSGTYCAFRLQGTVFNLVSDEVYYRGDRAVICPQYVSGSFWEFKGKRWDANGAVSGTSQLLSTTGLTDRDRAINYSGFPNYVTNVTLRHGFTESGTGIVFDAVNIGLQFDHWGVFDTATVAGTTAIFRLGVDANGAGAGSGNPLLWNDLNVTGSNNFNTSVLVASNSSNTFPGIQLHDTGVGQGASSVSINANSLNFPLFVYGSTNLCLDPTCNAADGGQIINRGASFNTIYALHAKGARDGSAVPDYISFLGRYLVQFPQDNWGKRRRWFFDTATDNNYCLSAPGNDSVANCSAAHLAVDNLGNLTALGTLTWNGGNRISKVLQTQSALTFGAIAAQTCGNQTVTLTGAATSNGTFASPNYAVEAGLSWSAFVSASGTVTVRVCNATSGSITPAASSNWRVWVVQE